MIYMLTVILVLVGAAASAIMVIALLNGNKGQYQALVTDIGLPGRSDGCRPLGGGRPCPFL